ncbi:MAG: hypothetical protein FWD84_04460, partial [Oscillospiraceae bacterium]|nr:hypothetical protein [Oscillospiraceae bacterium]
LNRVLPDLNINYRDVIENGISFVETIEATARAEAERLRNANAQEAFVGLIAKEMELRDQHAALTEEMAAAQERYNAAQEAHAELLRSGLSHDPAFAFSEVTQEFFASQEALRYLTEAYEANTGAMTENAEYLDNIRTALGEFAGEAGGAREGYLELQTAIAETRMKMEELAAAYYEVYSAALTSIQGQFRLWDEAPAVVARSVGAVNQALQSQLEYWQGHNERLLAVSARAGEFYGLREFAANFADGSTESVAMMAGLYQYMQNGQYEQVQEMLGTWQLLQEEQNAVAESTAELVTDFAAQMDELQSELESTIQEMNLGDEAAESGRNTIQGFINGAWAMLPQVEAAFARIGQAAMRSIDNQLRISSPSREMEWRAEMVWAGYINKTREMQSDVEQAMAETAGGGAEAFAKEQAEFVAFAPQLLQALATRGMASNPVMAQYGGGGITYHISIAPQYYTSGIGSVGQLGAVYAANNDHLRELIVEVMDDENNDRARRAQR